MRILVIGDPHGDLDKIKKIPLKGIDLILLNGDLGKADLARKRYFKNVEREKRGLPKLEDTPDFNKKCYMQIYDSSIKVLKYLSKIAPVHTIFGNVESHDSEIRKMEKEIGLRLPKFVKNFKRIKRVYIINNRLRNFNGVRIGGLEYFIDVSWIKEFKPSNYKDNLNGARKETKKSRAILSRFKELDILVCHQPPYGILDKVTFESAPKHWQGKNAGSLSILKYIQSNNPKYVFCGHIHEGEGFAKIKETEVYNLGVCGYKIIEL
jgi:Icc-related predicted phosphoesterase